MADEQPENQAQRERKVIEADEFVVRDEKGQVRIRIGVDNSGSASVRLYADDEKPRVSVEVVQIENPIDVRPFIREHPSLIPVLEEAPQCISKYFGDAKLSLKIEADYEEEKRVTLLLLVETALAPKEARQRREELRNAWWREASKPVCDLMSLIVTFR